MRTVTVELYRFSELPDDAQNRIAHRWLNLARAYGEPSKALILSLAHALECLMTEPDEKYTAEGFELHI